MADFRTELDKVADQGCVLMAGCCWFATCTDWEHTMRGGVGEAEVCCFKHEACMRGEMVSFPLGIVERPGQICNVSMMCWNVGLIEPNVCFKGKGQFFCMNGRGELPCVDHVPFLIAGYGWTCYPVCACCIPIESVSKPALASTADTGTAPVVDAQPVVPENKA